MWPVCLLAGPSKLLLPQNHILLKSVLSATVAHPTEIIKCKLQLQLVQPEHVPRQFSGPIDVVRQTVTQQGVTGMWRGLGASFIYRSCFAAMFGSKCYKHPKSSCANKTTDIGESGFEAFNRLFKSWDGTNWAMSAGLANFLAGGMASNAYWLTALRKWSAYMCDYDY